MSIYIKYNFYVEICHIIFPYRVVSKLSWYSKGPNFTNRISIFNHEFVYQKILKILDIIDMQNTQKKNLKQIYTSYSIYGVLMCHLSVWALKLPPSRASISKPAYLPHLIKQIQKSYYINNNCLVECFVNWHYNWNSL